MEQTPPCREGVARRASNFTKRLGAIPWALVPLARSSSPRRRRMVMVAAVVMLVALVANLATGLGLGGDGMLVVVSKWGQNVVLVAAVALCGLRASLPGADRAAWTALTAALAAWTVGNLYWTAVLYDLEAPPFPSPADAGWLLFFPLAYLSLGLLLRTSVRRFHASMWLDGLVGALTAAGLGTAFVLSRILAGAEGSRATVLVNAAYPIGDLLLACLVIGVLGLYSWRPGRAWVLLGAGFTIFGAADSIYLYRLAADAYSPGTVLDSLWLVGASLMALAAWQHPRPAGSAVLGGWRTMALPFGFGLASIALLVAAGLGHLNSAAVAFAGAAVMVSMIRTSLTFRELRTLGETRQQASTDELTGLPNRRWFHQHLRAAIADAERAGGELALLSIDLDHFKELNDTLGHHAGDLVLAQLGPRLHSALRAGDVLARVGGDEFAALLPNAQAAQAAGDRIADVLEQRFLIDGLALQVGASIGVALYPEHAEDGETLLRRADVAMYQAKGSRSGTEFYARERDGNTRGRLQMLGELRDAVAAGQLILHYQPKLDLRQRRITGVEALVRWPHPTLGLVPPGDFIPLAEQAGLMAPLTNLVLDQALDQAARWRASGFDLIMAINVSATNLLDGRFTDAALAALSRGKLTPESLVIEITEDVIMADPERSLDVVGRLSAAGVRVALDDFGTGYSSLAYLKHLPVDELKIDRSFVSSMATDAADAAIVQTTIDLGRRLGIAVVAEGVEDAVSLETLAAMGATSAQGFHIARPMPADDLLPWLEAGAPRLADLRTRPLVVG
ncbi:MAG TPA: EAL domain-containing protein [Solirubrobacteraceae bacterium]|nr:EAL domain-containing protein [Solirubrobacteraceae bacterium]